MTDDGVLVALTLIVIQSQNIASAFCIDLSKPIPLVPAKFEPAQHDLL